MTNSAIRADLYRPSPKALQKVAIVGGGIAASCVAYELLQQHPELNIQIFCKDDKVAAAASGNRQGAIYPLLQASESNISLLFKQSFDVAIEFYQQLYSKGIKFEHQWCGVLQQAMTPELLKRFTKVSQLWPDVCELISEQSSTNIAGLSLPYPSLYFPNGGWLAPFELCQSTFSYLQKNFDLRLHVSCPIQETKKTNGKWSLTSDEQSFEGFDAVVFCTGIDTLDVNQAQILPLEAIRGQVSQANVTSSIAPLKTVLCHKGYMTPHQGEHQCFGATFDKGNRKPEITEQDSLKNIEQVKAAYPAQDWAQQLSVSDVPAQRAGIRANSPDHSPMVGSLVSQQWLLKHLDVGRRTIPAAAFEDDQQLGLYVLTGLGARGLTTAPLMAKHLTSILLNKASPLEDKVAASIAPLRFVMRRAVRGQLSL